MKYSLIIVASSIMLIGAAGVPKFSKHIKKSYNFVPSGLVVLEKDTLSVQSFYMLNHEITNFEYLEFLSDLEKQGRTKDLEIARIRSENWNSNVLTNKPMEEYYHKHPAYREYPVVNITHQAASLYCAWLTEKLNHPSQKLGIHVVARLPFHAEYIRAGAGDNLHQAYPWKYIDIINEKGEILCNFQYIPNSLLSLESNKIRLISDGAMPFSSVDILAPVKSYWPSEYGIYNLSGNAAEMTNISGQAVGGSWRDLGYDVRLRSSKSYDESDVSVGFRVVVTWLKE